MKENWCDTFANSFNSLATIIRGNTDATLQASSLNVLCSDKIFPSEISLSQLDSVIAAATLHI